MYISQTLRRAVQLNGQGTATVFASRRQTWREFEDRIACLANGLLGLGVNAGDRVAILALNSDRYLEYFYAVPWAGAAVNPVNIRLAPPEVAYTLNDSGSTVLFVDDTFAALLPSLQSQLESIKHVVFMGEGECPQGCIDYEPLVANSDRISDANAGGGDLAGLFYTGGTTGRSKGVMLSHDNLVFNALNVVAEMGYDSDTIYMHAGPMFHLADMASTFAVTLAAGTHGIVPRFDVDEVLAFIEQEKVTNTLLVPTMVNLLASSGRIVNYDVSSIKRMLYLLRAMVRPKPPRLLPRSDRNITFLAEKNYAAQAVRHWVWRCRCLMKMIRRYLKVRLAKYVREDRTSCWATGEWNQQPLTPCAMVGYIPVTLATWTRMALSSSLIVPRTW
jgi:acyl-CoA synthetase (AMP-forming)/AMP-acid ligase II